MENTNSSKYSQISAFEIIKKLNSNEQGLNKDEVKKRFQESGPNSLPEAKVDSLLKIFFNQFKSPLIYILLIAGITVFLMGEKIDSIIVVFVIFFNSIVGTFQEGKAQNTLLALKKLTKTTATVIREGKEQNIPAKNLVVGDIIILREGEKIPADARIIFSNSLKINESPLTGESNPVHKISDIDNENRNIVFKGTSVISGIGKAIVTAIGIETEIGKITEKIIGTKDELPLKKNIARLSNLIIIIVALSGVLLSILGIINGLGAKEIFTMIVAISVSVIPEGLPIVVTLVLATGVWRMSKRSVLIKKLQAVEALGQTTVIAVDKTGTITKNQLMVEKLYTNGKIFDVQGFGYEPEGDIALDGKTLEPINHKELLLAGKIAMLNSNVFLSNSKRGKDWKVSGDPTEASIMVLAEKIGFEKDVLEKEMPKLDEIPFNYETKYHATLHSDKDSTLFSAVGSPEAIIGISEKIWRDGKEEILDNKEKENLEKIQNSMSENGLRVVAFAYKNLNITSKKISKENSDLVFVGFFGIMDGLRKNVKESVKKVTSANIKLIMITGDYALTAKAIASEAGIYSEKDNLLTGDEIENMSEEELSQNLKNVTVFARVTPNHKLKIINAYKLNGEIIAMTGDGVNDALSLTSADVGVSMGKIGTEVAKEASDIILMDDNFASIVSGIEEGRNIFKSIKKVILYLISTSLGELFTIILALSAGLPLPILPAQILWLNLITDGFLDVALAMEPNEKGLLIEKRFKKSSRWLVDGIMLQRMILMALPMAIGTIFIFSKFYDNIPKAWTISLTTLAIFQWFNAWNCRSENKSIFKMNFFSNKFLLGATITVIILQFIAVYTPFMQKLLRTVPLEASDWLIMIVIASSIILVEEIRKFIYSLNKKV